MIQILLVALWLGLSAVAAASAHAKGHNGLLFFFVSVLASPFLTLPAILLAEAQAHPSHLRGETLGCHYCGQPRPADSPVCPSCKAGSWTALADPVAQCGHCSGKVLRTALSCLHCGTILQKPKVVAFPLLAQRVPRQRHLAPAIEE